MALLYFQALFVNASLSQSLDKTPETKKLADEYGISEGKAQLINEILKIKEDYTFKDLSTFLAKTENIEEILNEYYKEK